MTEGFRNRLLAGVACAAVACAAPATAGQYKPGMLIGAYSNIDWSAGGPWTNTDPSAAVGLVALWETDAASFRMTDAVRHMSVGTRRAWVPTSIKASGILNFAPGDYRFRIADAPGNEVNGDKVKCTWRIYVDGKDVTVDAKPIVVPNGNTKPHPPQYVETDVDNPIHIAAPVPYEIDGGCFETWNGQMRSAPMERALYEHFGVVSSGGTDKDAGISLLDSSVFTVEVKKVLGKGDVGTWRKASTSVSDPELVYPVASVPTGKTPDRDPPKAGVKEGMLVSKMTPPAAFAQGGDILSGIAEIANATAEGAAVGTTKVALTVKPSNGLIGNTNFIVPPSADGRRVTIAIMAEHKGCTTNDQSAQPRDYFNTGWSQIGSLNHGLQDERGIDVPNKFGPTSCTQAVGALSVGGIDGGADFKETVRPQPVTGAVEVYAKTFENVKGGAYPVDMRLLAGMPRQAVEKEKLGWLARFPEKERVGQPSVDLKSDEEFSLSLYVMVDGDPTLRPPKGEFLYKEPAVQPVAATAPAAASPATPAAAPKETAPAPTADGRIKIEM